MPKGEKYEATMRKGILLSVIYKLGSIELTDLYKIFNLDSTTLKNDIRFLKDNGLITTNGDRRHYKYALTQKGRSHLFSKEVENVLENFLEVC